MKTAVRKFICSNEQHNVITLMCRTKSKEMCRIAVTCFNDVYEMMPLQMVILL